MANLPVKTDKEILPRRKAKVPAKRAYSVALPTASSYPFPYEVPVPLARSKHRGRPEETTTTQATCSQQQQRSSASQDSTQELGSCNDMATTAAAPKTSPLPPPARPPRPNLTQQHSSPTPKPRNSTRPAVSPRVGQTPSKPRPPPMPKPTIPRKMQSETTGFTRSHSETVSIPSTGNKQPSPAAMPRSNSAHIGKSVPATASPPIPKRRTGSFVSRTQNSMSASSLEVSNTSKSPHQVIDSRRKLEEDVERYDPTKSSRQEEEDNPYESVGFTNKDNTCSEDKDPEQSGYAVVSDRDEEDDEDKGGCAEYAEIGDKESDEEEECRGDYEVIKQADLDVEDEERGDYEIVKDKDEEEEEEEDVDYVPMGSSASTTPEPPARPPVLPARPSPATAPPVPNFPPPRPSRSPQPPRVAVETSTPSAIDDDEYTPMSFPDEHNSIYEVIDLSRPIPPPRRKKKNKLKQQNSLPVSISPSNSFSSSSPGHTKAKQAQKTKQAQMASPADRRHDNYVTLYKK